METGTLSVNNLNVTGNFSADSVLLLSGEKKDVVTAFEAPPAVAQVTAPEIALKSQQSLNFGGDECCLSVGTQLFKSDDALFETPPVIVSTGILPVVVSATDQYTIQAQVKVSEVSLLGHVGVDLGAGQMVVLALGDSSTAAGVNYDVDVYYKLLNDFNIYALHEENLAPTAITAVFDVFKGADAGGIRQLLSYHNNLSIAEFSTF